MKEAIVNIIQFLLWICMCAVFVSGIVFLAYNNKPGWGWLTFVFVLVLFAVKIVRKDGD